jgi:hypothetical protein
MQDVHTSADVQDAQDEAHGLHVELAPPVANCPVGQVATQLPSERLDPAKHDEHSMLLLVETTEKFGMDAPLHFAGAAASISAWLDQSRQDAQSHSAFVLSIKKTALLPVCPTPEADLSQMPVP